MKKKFIATILVGTLVVGALSGCGNSTQETVVTTAQTEETTTATNDTEAEDTAKAEEEAAAKAAEEEADREEEANSYYEVGRACLYGLDGQKIDLEEAYTNFEKALELGNTDVNFYLGALCYDWYGYPETDYTKAKTYFDAAENNPYAQILLGMMYYYGEGVEEDKIKGQELIDNAIAQGYIEGYVVNAFIAEDEGDYETSFEYYNKALECEEQLFVSMAMRCLGHAYTNGQGVEQDYVQAMEWFEKAADLGSSTSMNWVGYMYENGQGVEQDYAKAVEWYEKGADLGNTSSMNYIGNMYMDGLGVEQDYNQAMEWYKKSAELGNVFAMGNIAYLYENGLGVEQDSAKAQEWNDKATAAE